MAEILLLTGSLLFTCGSLTADLRRWGGPLNHLRRRREEPSLDAEDAAVISALAADKERELELEQGTAAAEAASGEGREARARA